MGSLEGRFGLIIPPVRKLLRAFVSSSGGERTKFLLLDLSKIRERPASTSSLTQGF